jgi:hypothetical protein
MCRRKALAAVAVRHQQQGGWTARIGHDLALEAGDGLPARVWKELWPVPGDDITRLFTRSLETGRVPQE